MNNVGRGWLSALTIPLPDDKILALSKFKVFVDDNFSMAYRVQFLSDKIEKHCDKRKKRCLLAFPSFLTMFSKGIFYQNHL